MWGNGSCKPRSLGHGTPVLKEVNTIMQFCSAMEVQGSERPILGNKDELRGI